MIFTSPAKLNFSLNVGARRADGYHELNSVFHLISLHDTLELTPAADFTFTCDVDLGIPADDNLIIRAARAMAELHERPLPATHLHLSKRIPHGAGLGGGSSNAATTIYALSRLWGVRPDSPDTLALAAELGSDVPLFLAPTSASVMTGKGEQLAQSLSPVPDLSLVIVYPPGVHSSTGEVYRVFDTNPQPQCAQDALITEMQELSRQATVSDGRTPPISSLAALLYNNLEDAATSVAPETKAVLTWLRGNPLVAAALVAGSGSACWALCAAQADAGELADAARSCGWWAQEATTICARAV